MVASLELTPQSPNSPLAPETVLQDRYRVVRQLGKGGMGAVYEAVDQRLGITVALKETFSTETASRKQFAHEARLLAGMQHPALPRVTDHFSEGDRAFLVMQFIAGVDLARIIAQQPGPFPREQVIAWADQLLDALIYLHSRDRQVIHRDIKPHNLKLTSNGQIALLDFGLARAQPTDPNSTSSQAFFGYTRQYAPLEQIQDQRTDPRSDIYALGATLYHLLTGLKPPDALVRAAASVNGDPDPLKAAHKVNPAVGLEIGEILTRAMAQKAEDRFANAADFREALRRIGREKLPTEVTSGERKRASGETGELQMAMVVSARRFGPGAITLVMASVFILGATIYIAQGWLTSFRSATIKAAGPITPLKKSERPATDRARPVGNTPVTPKADSSAKGLGREGSVGEFPSKPNRSRKQGALVPQKPNQHVDAPSIRLPQPQLKDNFSAPAEAPLKTLGSGW